MKAENKTKEDKRRKDKTAGTGQCETTHPNTRYDWMDLRFASQFSSEQEKEGNIS